MWSVERDPALTSTFLNVTFLDREADFADFTARMDRALVSIPRLRQRIVPARTPWESPSWQDDGAFDLARHVRQVSVPAPGDDRAVLDLAAREYQQAFDADHPMWAFTVVTGLSGGRGALLAKMHHTISDGVGAIRLSAMFTDIERHPGPTEIPTLVPVADPVAEEDAGGGIGDALVGAGKWALGRVVRRVTQPGQLPADAVDALETVRSVGRQVFVNEPARSTLWTGRRSLARRFEILATELEPARLAAKAMGGSLNDFYVAAVAGGAGAYHRAKGVEVDELRLSMPVNTREDKSAGGNDFSPARVLVPAGETDPRERFRIVHERLSVVKSERSFALTDGLAQALRGLPPPVLLWFARQQVSTVDFAASNTRGAPFDLFIGGAQVLANHPMGPTGGTAFNATLMSYRGNLDVGINIDAHAVTDPELLRDCISDAFVELVEAGSN